MPDEVSWWQNIESITRQIFSSYNYKEIRPPLLEEALLFNRSLGDSAEIVRKQMFIIKNDKDTYALRPEATASVVRAYIENNLDKTRGLQKLYYLGPMFRLERPQKGRLRQFHHLGCEVIGLREPEVDVEVISLANHLLKSFSIEGYKIKINSLGCAKDKKELTQILSKNLKDKLSQLCADCKVRFRKNTLRILDCKNEECVRIVSKLNITDRHLCPECSAHFALVKEGLGALNLEYEVSPYLVRGLDYYTRTVFEITHQDLGSQDAIGAGGRYDNLVSELGGPDVGAIGFAFGTERLLLVSSVKCQASNGNLVYLITLGEAAKKQGLKLLDNLRKAEITSDMDYENKSLKGALRKANDLGAHFVIIIGEDELKKDVVTLKDMVSGEQREVKQEELIKELNEKSKIQILPNPK